MWAEMLRQIPMVLFSYPGVSTYRLAFLVSPFLDWWALCLRKCYGQSGFGNSLVSCFIFESYSPVPMSCLVWLPVLRLGRCFQCRVVCFSLPVSIYIYIYIYIFFYFIYLYIFIYIYIYIYYMYTYLFIYFSYIYFCIFLYIERRVYLHIFVDKYIYLYIYIFILYIFIYIYIYLLYIFIYVFVIYWKKGIFKYIFVYIYRTVSEN